MNEKMKRFVSGLIMGRNSAVGSIPMAVMLAGKKQEEQTPIAYLYNGVQLPPLPEWDRETYPYAVIGYCDTHGYVFTYSSTPWTADANGEIFPSRFPAYHLSDDGTTWESNNGLVHYITPVWTNTDILNTDGTLYLAASEPIPVYE